MARTSAIAWTKSTFNPWIGCTKVGPGCDGCYAEALDKRMKFAGATHWGPGVPRHRTSEANWKSVLEWNRKAPESEFAGRKGFWPVFCASLADVFDNEVPFHWREDLWLMIQATPNLSWLLVTKRIGNVAKMVPNWCAGGFPTNVRIIITVVNQEEADRDIPKLLALPCKNGISYEPALGPVNWLRYMQIPYGHDRGMIEWMIIGGESEQAGSRARPFDVGWAVDTIGQCRYAGVPHFMKQVGRNPFEQRPDGQAGWLLKDRAGADPAEWPEYLRVREFPR